MRPGRVGLMHLDPAHLYRRSGFGHGGRCCCIPATTGCCVAAEQIQPGDIVVAGLIAECSDGYFGDLLATSFKARALLAIVECATSRH
jgi:4-hydroxy-4-methyl-2-oxoglutarate aldolase